VILGKHFLLQHGKKQVEMACHPSGITFDAVGLRASSNGRSCENHECCGVALEDNMVIRVTEEQVLIDGKEQKALAAYCVNGGMDTCKVGFTRRHLLAHKDEYDGRLAQIRDIFSKESESPTDRAKHNRNKGCTRAVLIEAEYHETPNCKRPRTKEGLSTPK